MSTLPSTRVSIDDSNTDIIDDITVEISSSYEAAHHADSLKLNLLREYYPSVKLDDKIERLDLIQLLQDLVAIEQDNLDRLETCRVKDNVRGREIIPDYDTVNEFAKCNQDQVINAVKTRIGDVVLTLQRLKSL